MEKLDALVAAAGALILAVAVVGASLTAAPAATYVGTPREQAVWLDDGNAGHPTEGAYTDTFSFAVASGGVTDLYVNATVTYLPQGPVGGAAMHTVLRAPNGTAYELDGEPGGSPTQPTLTASFVIALAPAPAPRTVDASDVSAARAEFEATPPTDAVGEWKLEVSFSPGLAPATSSTVAWEASARGWTWDVVPAVPPGR